MIALGFDDWFQERFHELGDTDYAVARITAVDRDRYLIRNAYAEIQAELTGKLRFSAESRRGLPCVGDWVLVQYYDADALAIIHGVLPRKTLLQRKSPGKEVDFQLIASNIDVAFVVQSCDANFNLRRLERYLVMINEGHVGPVILLSKADLMDDGQIQELVGAIREAGYDTPIVVVSSMSGRGMSEFREVLQPAKTYALLGSSGVGKTTLMNILLGRETFETAPIREKDGRGRHTTTRRHLIVLDNGAMLIDNPGMRELGFVEAQTGLDETFGDIVDLGKQCRFRDCTHTQEVGCCVLSAIESGELSPDRYQNYMKLARESAYHERSYVEKRARDKEFGKLYKSIIKHKKDRR